jgi:putative Holliday junction resolvase
VSTVPRGKDERRDDTSREDTGPVGGRRRELPAVPPARPRPQTGSTPVHHPTTEIDLSQGFPPVSHETSEIDLSGGWPQHLKIPPRRPGAAASSARGRVLGVDVGTVRVGVALSDPTRTLASPLETLRRAKDGSDLDRLAALVVQHEVTEVVVGEPRHLSGASGASARDASAYSEALAGRIADVPVHLIDERLSTVTAASHLRDGGIDARRQRPVIDQAAAVVILQQFLDSQRAGS